MAKQERKPRELPRPFAMHWGKGQVVEEASCVGEYHEPALQLLEYDDGSVSVRFCYYDHSGRFQRSPLMVGEDVLGDLRDSLAHAPRLRELLRRLVE